MVGVVDLRISEVKSLPKPKIRLGRAGFTLIANLGRFTAKTKSSWSGRKWTRDVLQLSWDGGSPLRIKVETEFSSTHSSVVLPDGLGKKHLVVCRGEKDLRQELSRGTCVLNFTLDMHRVFEEDGEEAELNDSANSLNTEGYEPITVSFSLAFIDLRS